MARAQRRLFIIVAVVFVGIYLLNQNLFFGHWFFLGHINLVKWLVLGLGLWIIFGCLSTRPRRYRRYGYDNTDRYSRRSDRDLRDRIDCLQAELTELRHRRERSTRASQSSELYEKLKDLTERIVTLEKIVTDRRYQLDDELDKL